MNRNRIFDRQTSVIDDRRLLGLLTLSVAFLSITVAGCSGTHHKYVPPMLHSFHDIKAPSSWMGYSFGELAVAVPPSWSVLPGQFPLCDIPPNNVVGTYIASSPIKVTCPQRNGQSSIANWVKLECLTDGAARLYPLTPPTSRNNGQVLHYQPLATGMIQVLVAHGSSLTIVYVHTPTNSSLAQEIVETIVPVKGTC